MVNKSWTCLAMISLVLPVLLGSAWADTGLGRHKKLYAVPAPGKITVDGKLDDWDVSGQVLMYVVSETADMQSARFALQYDADALYIGAIIRDPSPMMNRHDPKVDGDKGWDADACQFRMTLDPAMGYPISIGHGTGDMANPSVIHLILWYCTDTQTPCLQMHASMQFKSPRPEWEPFGVVPANLFLAKYVKMADGGGYTFEYRIPWSTLGAKTPLKGGDLAAGTVQFNWSQADGLKTAGGSAWCYDVMAGPGFPYQHTGCWGKIIFSDKGNLAKELVEEGVPPEKPLPLKFAYGLPQDSQITIQLFNKDNMCQRILVAQGDRRAGQNVELWDGLDDGGSESAGKPLPAGDYTWKGIYHEPIKQKFLFSPHNSGQPPFRTDDNTGGWGGDHGVPTSPCVFDGGVLLAWNVAEAGWGIIRCTSETLTGQIVKLDNLPGSGGKSRYFLLAGAADARVTEIFGLDTVKPLPGGTCKLSEADAKLAADALAGYNAKITKSKRLSIARGRTALATADPVGKAIDNARSFTARAAYDEKNLLISFDVISPYELVNAIADTRMIFKGGNCLDIQLAADPAADPKRKPPAPGDVRILATRQGDKPLAVVYRPKIKDFKGEPIVLSSPTGKESFDAIEASDAVALEYARRPPAIQPWSSSR